MLLLGLALAGCATSQQGAEPPPAAPGPAPATTTLPWTLTDCRELAVFFEADPAAVAPHFPPGFTPGPGMTPATTTVGMDAFRCATGSAVHGERHDVSYASFWAVADPPAELRGDVSQWFVKWLATVDDPDTLAALQAIGTTVTTGTVDYADVPLPQGGTVATIKLDGVGDCTITVGPEIRAPTGGSDAGVPLREFTVATDGSIVTWQATLTRPDQALSAGTLSVPPGSVLAAIAGTSTIPVVVADGQGGGLSAGTISWG